MLEVAEHYYHFGGKSPINDQNRALIAALTAEFARRGINLPIYWGNRNWHPLLADTLREMAGRGVRRALVMFTSAFSSYSGCRQYQEDLARARAEVGPAAPACHKLRGFFNHPGFILPMIERLRAALEQIPLAWRDEAAILFTAHSIPRAMAETCEYERQLHEACRLVADGVGRTDWRLVYQSRSGPPAQPWLEPDVLAVMRQLAADHAARSVVVVPIGFISDHLEVLYDLDTEAKQLADELGLGFVRAATVGTHPRFVEMIAELVQERLAEQRGERPLRLSLGSLPPLPDECPVGCCAYLPRRPA
jgi:ferrochelatase